jgi:hypothetical protein
MREANAMRAHLIGAAAMLGLAAVCLASLGACAKGGGGNAAANAAGGNEAAAAAPAAAAPAAASAPAGPAGPMALTDLPAPTAGEWSRASSQDGGAVETSTKCMSGKSIDPSEGLPGKCATMTAERTATGGFKVTGDCPNNGVDAKLMMAAEGDFKKSFTMDAQMTMTGGPGGDITLKNHSVYTYVGPTCSK